MRLIPVPSDGDRIDALDTMYPCSIEVVRGAERTFSTPTSTYYGMVLGGRARVTGPGLSLEAESGTFFAMPGPVSVSSGEQVVVIERLGFRGLPSAGRIESKGRLAYIDGCSDTILVMPPRQGDPVLNHLHFPAQIVQTLHRHPSVRLGVVARGAGEAFGRNSAGHEWVKPLAEGSLFMLEPHEAHAFRTTGTAGMDVIAFHPDSDWGPRDEAHPMINRTYVTSS